MVMFQMSLPETVINACYSCNLCAQLPSVSSSSCLNTWHFLLQLQICIRLKTIVMQYNCSFGMINLNLKLEHCKRAGDICSKSFKIKKNDPSAMCIHINVQANICIQKHLYTHIHRQMYTFICAYIYISSSYHVQHNEILNCFQGSIDFIG